MERFSRSPFSCLVSLMIPIDIIARKFETMAETYIRLKSEARRTGFVINVSKTKYMMAKGSREELPRPSFRISIDGDEIEAVEEFLCFSSMMTADNDTSRAIQIRIVAGNRAYFGLRRTLRSITIRRHTKLAIYKMLIRPVVLDGHETWTLRAEDQRDYISQQMILRNIYRN